MFARLRRLLAGPARPAAGRTVGTDAPRVLVAGASGAIGTALAAAFAADGARLALHGRRRADALAALAGRLGGADGTRPAVLTADCASAVGAQALFADAEAALGGVPDVLVIAIGTARDDALPMLSDADAAQTIADNLAPVVHLCEAMRAARAHGGGGRIVIVASITGLVGQPMRALYGAAKGATMAYAKSLARETAASGLTVNCIAPQVLDGGLASLMRAHVRQTILGATPLARACQPDDLAAAARFLASPGAGYVTGTVVNVTGGLVTW